MLDTWGIPVFVIGTFLLVFLYVWWAAKKRKEALIRFAQRQGLSFVDSETPMQNTHLSSFHLFQLGYDQTFKNVMQGYVDGQNIKLFDYSYTTGSGKSRSTQTQTAIVFNVQDKELPGFELRPENFFYKIGSLLGHSDIDFPEDLQFSKKYYLKGKDKTAIRELFNSNIRNYFLSGSTWCVEGGGEWLIIYNAAKKTKADQLPQFLTHTFEIYRLFI